MTNFSTKVLTKKEGPNVCWDAQFLQSFFEFESTVSCKKRLQKLRIPTNVWLFIFCHGFTTLWFKNPIVRHVMGLIIVNCSSIGIKYNFDLQKGFWPSVPSPSFEYRISSYSFRGNYSFLNLEIVANSNNCCNISIFYLINCGNYSREENYSRAETIWGNTVCQSPSQVITFGAEHIGKLSSEKRLLCQ